MKSIRMISACFVLLLFSCSLFGCYGARAQLQITSPVNIKLGTYKKVVINTSTKYTESPEERIQLERMVIAGLKSSNVFESVISSPNIAKDSADLTIDLKIVELRKVGLTPLVAGVFAGQSKMVVDVELIDLRNKKLLGTFNVEGKPDRENLFEDTYSGIQFISDKIIEYVKSKI